jgi:4-amino-4-deoxy-L-arabinose transferase-like glycosyltransferase
MATPAPSSTARPTPPWWCATAAARLALVGGAAACVLLAHLGSAPLWDDDEPKNTACTVSMLARGDWVVPRFNEALRSDKPPLVNWIQLAGFAVCGVNETGARLGSALLTVGTAILVADIATRLFPALPWVGLWSGLALGTCVWSAVAGRAATPDASLCFCTTLALWIFVAARSWPQPAAGRMPPWPSAAVGLALGAAVLAKGPVGFVLPVAALGAFAWWQALAGSRPTPRAVCRGAGVAWAGMHPLVIGAAAVVVAGPWYALVWQRTNGAWIRDFLLTHNVGRFAAPMEGHWGPPFYYLLALAVGLFPWSVVAGIALADAAGCLRRGHDATPLRLLAAWAGVWVGCFSISGTKLPGYVWPAYPAAAILLGWFLERWRLGLATWSDRWMPVAWAVLATAGAGIAVGLPILGAAGGAAGRWPVLVALGAIGMVPIAAAALARAGQVRGDRSAALGWLAGGGGLTVALVAALGVAEVGHATGVRALVDSAEESRGAAARRHAAPIAWSSYRCSVPSLVFYSGAAARGERVARLAEPHEAKRFLAARPQTHVVVPAGELAELLAAAPPGYRVLNRARALAGYRELVLVGPGDERDRESLAGMPTEARVR